MAKIAFLLRNNNELAAWILGEAKSFPFTEIFGSGKPADAYVVLANGPSDAEEFLPIVEDQMFAWFGDKNERVEAMHPFALVGWEELGENADLLLITANEMHEKIEEERRKQKEAEKPTRPLLRPRLLRRQAYIGEEDQENEGYSGYDAIQEEPQVIAVGGHGGASYVAWNLAVVTKIPLIEGRGTGSLAKWTGDQTPVSQALEEMLPYGTVLDGELPKSIIGKRVIVDTGPDPRHPVFEHAKIRIWVTTLDPAQSPIPERAKVIVNRVPAHLPFASQEVVKANIDLEVPDGSVDALLSLFTRIPWVLKQDPEIQAKWQALVQLHTKSKKGVDDAWPTGW